MRERSAGHWELAVYAGRDPVTGREKLRRRTFVGGKRAAATELSRLVVEVEGDKRPVSDETIGWLLEQWLDLQSRAGLSPTTLRTYRGYIRNWLLPTLGRKRMSSLTAGDVRNLQADMKAKGRESSTVRQVHSILRGALSFALEHEWVDRNVAAQRKAPPQKPPEVRPPPQPVVIELLGVAGEDGSDLYTFVALAVTLGAREGELCGLRWSDVDLTTRDVRVERSAFEAGEHGGKKGVQLKATKTLRSQRTIRIDEPTADVLRARWEWQRLRREEVKPGAGLVADPYILSRRSDGSGPPSPSAYSRGFRRLALAIGRGDLHAHSLRHFMVSYALANGATLAEASERAGHASTAVTARVYANVLDSEESGRRLAAILGRALAPAPLRKECLPGP